MKGDCSPMTDESDVLWAEDQVQSQTYTDLLDCMAGPADDATDASSFTPPTTPLPFGDVDWETQAYRWIDENASDIPEQISVKPEPPSPAPSTTEPAKISLEDAIAVFEHPGYQMLPTTIPLPPAAAPPETPDVADTSMMSLMNRYRLTDDSLASMTVAKLQRTCKSSDFPRLKQYRRTCLNRQYARTSRNKRQNETEKLTDELSIAYAELNKLKEFVNEQGDEIRRLRLENDMLKALTD